MGTRSLVHIKGDVWEPDETPKTILTIYRQFDGYPTGMGEDLAKLLRGRRIVNGYGPDENVTQSNGMGCLAATIVKELKEGIGNVYIYPPDSEDCGEEYTYTISNDGTRDTGSLRLKVEGYGGILFDGAPEDFDAVKVEKG